MSCDDRFMTQASHEKLNVVRVTFDVLMFTVQRTDHGTGGASDTWRWHENRRQTRVSKGGGEIGEMNLHKISMKFETVTASLVISDEGMDRGH